MSTARYFDATNNYFTKSSETPPSSITLACWINPFGAGGDATDGGPIVGYWKGASPFTMSSMLLLKPTDTDEGHLYYLGDLSTTDTVAEASETIRYNSGWHFVAVTRSGSVPQLWIGSPNEPIRPIFGYSTQTAGSGSQVTTGSPVIYVGGVAGSSRVFNGILSWAAIWNMALEEAELDLFRRATLAGVSPSIRRASCVGVWPLQERGGNIAGRPIESTRLLSNNNFSNGDLRAGLPLREPWLDLQQLLAGATSGAGPTTYFQNVAGGITPAATLLKQTAKPLAGSSTPAATVVKRPAKTFTGAVTPSATVVKRPAKTLTGGTTPTGALTVLKAVLRTLTGSVTPTGALVKQAQKPVAGATTPAGTVARATAKSFAGSAAPSGSLLRATLKTFGGAIAPSGSVVSLKAVLRTFTGSIIPTGAVTKRPAKTLTGTTTPTGAMTKRPAKAFTGNVTPTGGLVKQARKTLTATIATAGTLVTQLITGGGQRNWTWLKGPRRNERRRYGPAPDRWRYGPKDDEL